MDKGQTELKELNLSSVGPLIISDLRGRDTLLGPSCQGNYSIRTVVAVQFLVELRFQREIAWKAQEPREGVQLFTGNTFTGNTDQRINLSPDTLGHWRRGKTMILQQKLYFVFSATAMRTERCLWWSRLACCDLRGVEWLPGKVAAAVPDDD